MTAIDYFGSPVDPFVMQKELGLTSAMTSISMLAESANAVFADARGKEVLQLSEQFQGFVITALWGNRMDLSIWPVGGNGSDSEPSGDRASESFGYVLKEGQKMMLANDIESLVDHVNCFSEPARIDIIVDNAGFELFCDLCLADFLIYSGMAAQVTLQLKAHPTFVSDAMAKDVIYTIEFLRRGGNSIGSDNAAIRILGDRWARHVDEGSWLLLEDFFWVQPQPMWEMPANVREDLSQSALVFVKGDANYRRLLGDLHWDMATPFADVVSYFPAPVCALRTLKAELGCGMSRECTERAAKEDSQWLVAGKYGVVQFCDANSK